jgi:hypothetical protein
MITEPLSLEDCAKGKNPRRWCNDCGEEFSKMPLNNTVVYGCMPCWKAKKFTGPCPQNAAPHGRKAAMGILSPLETHPMLARVAQRSNSSSALERRHTVGTSALELDNDGRSSPVGSKGALGRSSLKEGTSGSKERKSKRSKSMKDSKTLPAIKGEEPNSPQKGGVFAKRTSMCRAPGSADVDEDEYEDEEAAETERITQVLNKLYKKAKVREALDKLVKELNAKGNVYDLFQKFDVNGDKTLSREEMQVGLRSIGCSLLPIELDAVLRAFDSDGNGTVEYPEFYGILKYHQGQMASLDPVEDEEGQICGYNEGDIVRSLVRAKDTTHGIRAGSFELGSVIGAGIVPGTVLVFFEKSGHALSVRATQITRYEGNKTFERSQSHGALSRRTTM